MGNREKINWNVDRAKANFGIILFCFAIALHLISSSPMVKLISLVIMFIGWIIFSINHQKIASAKLKKITENYVNSIK